MSVFEWLERLFTRCLRRENAASENSASVGATSSACEEDVAPSACEVQRACSTTKPPVIEHDYSIELIETRLECDLGDIMSGTGAAHFTTDARLAGLDLAAPASVEKVQSLRDFCREHGDLIFTIERKTSADGFDRYPLLSGDFQTPNAVGFVAVSPKEWREAHPGKPSSVEDIHRYMSDFFESVVFEGMYGTAWAVYCDHKLIKQFDTKEEAKQWVSETFKTQARVLD